MPKKSIIWNLGNENNSENTTNIESSQRTTMYFQCTKLSKLKIEAPRGKEIVELVAWSKLLA